MSQQSLPQYSRVSYTDFSGGLSTRKHALKLGKNQFTQLDNAVLADHETIEKITGYVQDGTPWASTSDSFIRMLVNYRVGTSVDSLVVAAQDNNNTNATFKVDLKQTFGDGTYNYIGYTTGTATFTSSSTTVTGSGTAWDVNLKAGDQIKPNSGSTWYVIQTVVSATQLTLASSFSGSTVSGVDYMARIVLNYQAIPQGVVFNNHLVIGNGMDRPMVFDNTSLTLLQDADAPVSGFLEVHKNRVFMATTSTLYWSAVNDETVWSALSISPIYPEDNGNIVGIRSFSNSLIVFKDNGRIYQVYGEFDQDAAGHPALIRRIDTADNIGVISGRSAVVNDDGLLYFLAQTGIYTIDSRMLVSKISWDISPTVQNLIFTGSAASAAKSFFWAQKSQWDTGTLAAVQTFRPTNGLAPYFDNLDISSAFQGRNSVACITGSNNDVHIAWISSDKKTINYTKWLAADNTSSTQTVYNTSTVLSFQDINGGVPPWSFGAATVSIALASNGTIGIGAILLDNSGSYGTIFSEFSSGSWTTAGISARTATSTLPDKMSCSCTYNGGTSPYFTATVGTGHDASPGSTGTGITFHSRSGSTWSIRHIDDGDYVAESFCFDGSGNIHLIGVNSSRIQYYKSTNGGVSWTSPLTSSSLGTSYIQVAGTSPLLGTGSAHITLDDISDVIITYNFTSGSGGDVGKTIRYNVTPHTPVKTTVDTSIASLIGYNNNSGAETYYELTSTQERVIYDVLYSTGTATITSGSPTVVGQGTKWTTWVAVGDKIKASGDPESDFATVQSVNSDTSITLTGNYAGSSITASAYLAKHTYTVNTSFPEFSAVASSGDVALFNQNNVISLAGFNTSANTLSIRRISLFGKWTSPIVTDANLSSWGNFVVVGQVAAGNTIVYEIGLSSTGTITVGNTNPITNNSLISTNSALNHAKLVVTFIFGSFSAASISSATLNYTAPGVSAGGGQGATGFVFNNEMYLAVTENGNSQNNTMLFLDWRHAWMNYTVPIFCFARLKQTLYAGSSMGGTVYKLRSGYNAAGSAYTMTAITREDILGDIELEKELYKVYVIYQVQSSGTFTFSYSLDNYLRGGTASWTDIVVNQTSNSDTPGFQEISLGGNTCSSIQFKISQADSNTRVGIIGFTLLYSYLNLR